MVGMKSVPMNEQIEMEVNIEKLSLNRRRTKLYNNG